MASTLRQVRAAVAAVAIALAALPAVAGECPAADELLRSVEAAGLERGSRQSLFGAPFPQAVYRKAAERADRAAASREGNRVFGARVAPLSVESLWRAINDEDHFVGRLPVVSHSEVIDGTPRGPRRLLFQYFERAGVGRWWISEIRMNDPLYEASAGRLWELFWEDRIGEAETGKPPLSKVAKRLRALKFSRGSWLLLPLGDSCTLIEYFNESDPGGALAAAHALGAAHNVRKALEAVVAMARDHAAEPHEGAPFLRPDGRPLGAKADD